jgi:valyl-tRNA synthetase
MLIRARWPQADAAASDPAAEQEFQLLQDLIRQIRNVRTRHNVSPAKRLDVLVEPIRSGTADSSSQTPDVTALLGANMDLFRSQAQLGSVTIGQAGLAPPADAAAVAAAGVRLHVLGIVDRQAELTRLTKQAQMLEKGIKGIEGKLGNEKFLANAPPEVVAKERTRLESLQAELSAVQESLRSLG